MHEQLHNGWPVEELRGGGQLDVARRQLGPCCMPELVGAGKARHVFDAVPVRRVWV